MDFMLLVVDATKGMQTQTAEGLVIGELTTDTLVVALNKVDQFEQGEKDPAFLKMQKKIELILSKTKFAGAPMISVSAKSGHNVEKLLEQLIASAPAAPKRDDVAKDRFLFSVDHAFGLKGQGTVMTGTVLRGSVSVNDSVEIADLGQVKKVKSMQMFKKSVLTATQGYRLGLCVTQFDASTVERAIVCFPGSVTKLESALVSCSKIRYFSGDVKSGSRFHVSIGHRTVTARVFFLHKSKSIEKVDNNNDLTFEWCSELTLKSESQVLALFRFDIPVLCPRDSMYIASKLDADESTPGCRIAFHGTVFREIEAGKSFEKTIVNVFKRKTRHAVLERVVNDEEIICKGLFKSFDMNLLSGFKIEREFDSAIGEIRGSFGSAKNAKFKASFDGGCMGFEEGDNSRRLTFHFKKYLGEYDSERKKETKKKGAKVKWIQ